MIDSSILLVDSRGIALEERIPGEPLPVRAILHAGDEELGVLVGHLSATRAWERADQDLLELFASEIAVAIRNAQLFARVEAQNSQLLELDAAKDDFLRGVSHNLQTPLTSIRAYAHQLQVDLGDQPDRRLGIIAEQTDRLSRMVRQLLTVTRLESGALHRVEGAHLDKPLFHLPLLVLHVEPEPGMRVQPLDLRQQRAVRLQLRLRGSNQHFSLCSIAVEGMPSRTADEVSRGPQRTGSRGSRWRLATGQRRQKGQGRPAEAGHLRPQVDGLRGLPIRAPQLAEVGPVGLEDVTDDGVQLAAATAGTLSQGRSRRGLRGPVERGPACPQDRRLPLGFRLVQRPRIDGRRLAGGAEVGGGVALEPLDHPEGGHAGWRMEPGGRLPQGLAQPRAVVDQGLQSVLLVAPAPAPARPLEPAGEHALLPHLEVDGDPRG